VGASRDLLPEATEENAELPIVVKLDRPYAGPGLDASMLVGANVAFVAEAKMTAAAAAHNSDAAPRSK